MKASSVISAVIAIFCLFVSIALLIRGMAIRHGTELILATTNVMLEAEHSDDGAWIVHKPPSWKFCPGGWKEIPELFKEADGSRLPACALLKGHAEHIHTDYRLAGEAEDMELSIRS